MLPKSYKNIFSWIYSQDWFKALEHIPQDPTWHSEGNVLIHTKMVYEALDLTDLTDRQKYLLILSALMHDIGKVETTIKDENGILIAPRHSLVGSKKAQNLLFDLLPFEERILVTELIRLHGAPLHAWNSPVKTAVMSHTVPLYLLTKLVSADLKGRIVTGKSDYFDRFELWKLLVDELNISNKAYTFPNSHASKQAYNNELNILPSSWYEPHSSSTVIFLSGLPGAGKDTYYNKFLTQHPHLSFDDYRIKLGVKRGDQKQEGRMYQQIKEQFKEYLRNNITFVFNSTNLTKDLRGKWIKIAQAYNAKVTCVYIEPPFQNILKQNSSRSEEKVLPNTALFKLREILEVPHPLEFDKVDYITSFKL